MNVAIIPARGNSKGFLRKNLRPLMGKPLVVHTIEAALQTPSIHQVFVSTEDDEIAEVAFKAGANVLGRPDSLSMDDVQMPEVCVFTLRQIIINVGIKPTLAVILTPTCPLRTAQHIEGAIKTYRGEGSVFAGCLDTRFHWTRDEYSIDPVHQDPRNRQGRQQISDWLIAESGAIYVVGADNMLRERDFRLYPFKCYLMSSEDSLDIDTEDDLRRAEEIIRRRNA